MENLITNYEELRKAVNDRKSFVEVSEDLYYEALGSVPPIYLKNGTFQVSEPFGRGLFYTFGRKDGKYYGCICNANYSILHF